MKARVVFILLSFERKKKRKIDIKIKNKLFFIKSKLPGVSTFGRLVERERHYIYCRCLQTVTLAIGYYNRHIHYIHSGDG